MRLTKLTNLRRRLLLLLGVGLALFGLVAYWFSYEQQKIIYPPPPPVIAEAVEDNFELRFVLAGRDYDCYDHNNEPIYNENGTIIGWDGKLCSDQRLGKRTDTIFFVHVVGNDIRMMSIPRDVYLSAWQTRINSMYLYQGAEGLTAAAAAEIGISTDNYVIISMEIFENIVEALGGVEINVPYDMKYEDVAGGLKIDLDAGLQTLTAEQIGGFIRFRDNELSDFGRIDRVKSLALAMLQRLKEQNIRANIPAIIQAVFNDVETNIPITTVLDLVPRVDKITLNTITVPTETIEGSYDLQIIESEKDRMLAELYGTQQEELDIALLPDAKILVTNSSGEEELGNWMVSQLRAQGVDRDDIWLEQAGLEPITVISSTTSAFEAAGYYASMLHVNRNQVTRIETQGGTALDLQIILGQDAIKFYGYQQSKEPVASSIEVLSN